MSYTLDDFMAGDRVQLSPSTDAWMRGDRYGTVTGVGYKYVSVKLDRSGRTLRYDPILIADITERAPATDPAEINI
jgi:hypothetical protein